jgi:hypothetical protein
MRRLLLIAALISPTFAWADETISGQWRADMGHGVIINMQLVVGFGQSWPRAGGAASECS